MQTQSTDANDEKIQMLKLSDKDFTPTNNDEYSWNKREDSVFEETEDVKMNEMEIYN